MNAHYEGLDMRGGHGQVVQVQTLHPAIAAVIVAAGIIAIVFAISAYLHAEDTAQNLSAQIATLRADFARVEREAKINQIETQNQSALLLREGIKLPTDSEHGPAGNLSYRKRK